MSLLSLKIVPPFLPGIQKITPTYGHTKYNDKLADFKDNHKHPECYKACLLLDFPPHWYGDEVGKEIRREQGFHQTLIYLIFCNIYSFCPQDPKHSFRAQVMHNLQVKNVIATI